MSTAPVLDSAKVLRENDGPMDVVFAVLADSANVSQEGKLNMLGCFNHIGLGGAATFPVRHPEMQLVVRMEASAAEVGMTKKLEVKVLDEDGNQIGAYQGNFDVPAAKKAGERSYMQIVMRLVDTVFPKAGRYVFAILINDQTAYEVPLDVG